MKIYNYDEKTFEYLYPTLADKDPVQSKIKGEFVPLVPKFATTIKPPKLTVGEVAIFENNKWVKKVDYRFTHKKVDSNLIVSDITEIGEIEDIIVDIETALQICNHPDLFKIENDKVIKKTDEEIAVEQEQQEKIRIANLNLTGADVERGIYQAIGKDFEDIVEMVEASQKPSLDGEGAEGRWGDIDIKALKIEFKANHFYRGNPYVSAIGNLLGFTEAQLDKFFETNDYKCLLSEGEND